MSGIRVSFSKKVRETLTDPTDIANNSPYVTIIDSYDTSIAVADANRSGTIKKIYNSSGSTVSLTFGTLQGSGSNQLDMLDGTWAKLMFLGGEDVANRYRLIDGSLVGLTLVA